jgi:hypothetical protein
MPQATDDNAPIVTNGNPIYPAADTLASVCAKVHDRVTAFLNTDVEEESLKGVQKQTRIALGVIEECLNRYRYIPQVMLGVFIFPNDMC